MRENDSKNNGPSNWKKGAVPEQMRVLAEMNRVVKPGGIITLSTHGPEHNYEASGVLFKNISLRYIFGYRIEFWPYDEKKMKRMLLDARKVNVRTQRVTWQDVYQDGAKAYDFFTSTTSSWWVSKIPPNKIGRSSIADGKLSSGNF